MSLIDPLLEANPFVLLDGGMGQELISRGVSNTSRLWSAQALIDDPDMVLGVHRDYVAAGCDVLITNTYSTNGNRLRDMGMGDQLEPMNRKAGELARQAAEEVDRPVLVVASLPPLNGSFRPDETLPFDTIFPLYQEMAGLLAPYVDGFLCETMATAEEGRAAAKAATDTGKPTWVSWTLRDDDSARLRSGERILDALEHITDLPVEALMFNCSFPESLTAAVPALAAIDERQGRHFGGYANGFTKIPEEWGRWGGVAMLEARRDLDPAAYQRHAAEWYQAGARLIGGCCEVGPAHIKALADWRDSLRHTP
ncbi:MAG: homocysteine S-methyltransferase family protein [Pseudomonadota bacterium]